jgi:hypothetical protein
LDDYSAGADKHQLPTDEFNGDILSKHFLSIGFTHHFEIVSIFAPKLK